MTPITMANSMLPPVKPRRPGRPPGAPVLSLARRSLRGRLDAEGRPVVTRETMNPFAATPGAARLDAVTAEMAASLRQWEEALTEREQKLQDTEARLVEYERELAEEEALLSAREQLLAVARQATGPVVEPGLSTAEKSALEAWQAELERQEAALREDKAALREREAFLEESENRLFDKVQAQQELETELEQQAEELTNRERALNTSLGKAPSPPAPRDEFNE